jgi:hypothetical protein
MKFSMGGEQLGARTHGGHVPPHRAGGSSDGSTLVDRLPSPCREQRASVGQDRQLVRAWMRKG